jgi:hypothetical protein
MVGHYFTRQSMKSFGLVMEHIPPPADEHFAKQHVDTAAK